MSAVEPLRKLTRCARSGEVVNHPSGGRGERGTTLKMGAAAEASWASSPTARATMLANRSRDTRPELAVRRAVHALGLRYRVGARPVPEVRRTADLVFRPARIAVFVDGCFWHGCPEHATRPAANAGYWAEKFRRNRERDAETDALLRETGWRSIRVWEHEDPTEAATAISKAVRGCPWTGRRTSGS
ncbi:MAG: very short patch repair endonuclease [Candidatus Xenobia bacterium]